MSSAAVRAPDYAACSGSFGIREILITQAFAAIAGGSLLLLEPRVWGPQPEGWQEKALAAAEALRKEARRSNLSAAGVVLKIKSSVAPSAEESPDALSAYQQGVVEALQTNPEFLHSRFAILDRVLDRPFLSADFENMGADGPYHRFCAGGFAFGSVIKGEYERIPHAARADTLDPDIGLLIERVRLALSAYLKTWRINLTTRGPHNRRRQMCETLLGNPKAARESERIGWLGRLQALCDSAVIPNKVFVVRFLRRCLTQLLFENTLMTNVKITGQESTGDKLKVKANAACELGRLHRLVETLFFDFPLATIAERNAMAIQAVFLQETSTDTGSSADAYRAALDKLKGFSQECFQNLMLYQTIKQGTANVKAPTFLMLLHQTNEVLKQLRKTGNASAAKKLQPLKDVLLTFVPELDRERAKDYTLMLGITGVSVSNPSGLPPRHLSSRGVVSAPVPAARVTPPHSTPQPLALAPASKNQTALLRRPASASTIATQRTQVTRATSPGSQLLYDWTRAAAADEMPPPGRSRSFNTAEGWRLTPSPGSDLQEYDAASASMPPSRDPTPSRVRLSSNLPANALRASSAPRQRPLPLALPPAALPRPTSAHRRRASFNLPSNLSTVDEAVSPMETPKARHPLREAHHNSEAGKMVTGAGKNRPGTPSPDTPTALDLDRNLDQAPA